ncbi:cytochrome c oxidase subunit II [Uliginosibacterium sp. H1]|uniref:cytochrome c oxidase subunit II n=1 Tax=Uliginosibacterium sp. H1 TaxID=3114757 RepID=UPI002E192CA0|nr:cytochrome c oxidase subunit II [Uliginosibacterium sp. H1]
MSNRPSFEVGALSVLRPAGDEAAVLNELSWVLMIVCLTVFIGVMVLLGLSLRRNRPKLPASWLVIGGGIVFPVVVLTGLLLYGTARTVGLDRARPPDALMISVTGHMWWWEVRYQQADGKQARKDVVLANELRIPVGRPVLLKLESADVIHSFWVPALGGKMDTVPGRSNRLLITARAPGVYRGVCAEYCGIQHTRMGMVVVVQTPQEFQDWLARQARPAAPASGDAALRGRGLFMSEGCAACHTIRGVTGTSGTTAASQRGPDLTHIGSRLELGGVLRNHRGAMSHWIASVQGVKPGARMPSFWHLEQNQLDDLSTYLEQLR